MGRVRFIIEWIAERKTRWCWHQKVWACFLHTPVDAINAVHGDATGAKVREKEECAEADDGECQEDQEDQVLFARPEGTSRKQWRRRAAVRQSLIRRKDTTTRRRHCTKQLTRHPPRRYFTRVFLSSFSSLFNTECNDTSTYFTRQISTARTTLVLKKKRLNVSFLDYFLTTRRLPKEERAHFTLSVCRSLSFQLSILSLLLSFSSLPPVSPSFLPFFLFVLSLFLFFLSFFPSSFFQSRTTRRNEAHSRVRRCNVLLWPLHAITDMVPHQRHLTTSRHTSLIRCHQYVTK